MPQNWKQTYDGWKDKLNQVKNAALKAGGGTGVGKAIEDVLNADIEFQTSKSLGRDTVAEWRKLHNALDALEKKCTETSNKHKKLFTEACKYLDTVVKPAVMHRKTEARNELDAVLTGISNLCSRAAHSLGGATANPDAFEQIWDIYVEQFVHAAQGKTIAMGYANFLKGKEKPSTGKVAKDKYIQWAMEARDGVMRVS